MARRRVAAGAVLAVLSLPAAAQEGAVGPCSPYRAADGDIRSEMPGCVRRLRPAPGSLADELDFRSARKGVDAAVGPDDDGPPPDPPRRAGRPRPR